MKNQPDGVTMHSWARRPALVQVGSMYCGERRSSRTRISAAALTTNCSGSSGSVVPMLVERTGGSPVGFPSIISTFQSTPIGSVLMGCLSPNPFNHPTHHSKLTRRVPIANTLLPHSLCACTSTLSMDTRIMMIHGEVSLSHVSSTPLPSHSGWRKVTGRI